MMLNGPLGGMGRVLVNAHAHAPGSPPPTSATWAQSTVVAPLGMMMQSQPLSTDPAGHSDASVKQAHVPMTVVELKQDVSSGAQWHRAVPVHSWMAGGEEDE
jgi:hypothetical protein